MIRKTNGLNDCGEFKTRSSFTERTEWDGTEIIPHTIWGHLCPHVIYFQSC